MATISRENINLLNDRISVKVSQEDYLPGFQKELKQLSKQINLPGFRRGMVPAGLVKKMHGQEVYTREVIKSVEHELNEYIKKENLSLLGDPLTEADGSVHIDMNKPEDYQFSFEIGLKPEFEITPFNDGFHFTRYKVLPEEKDIDEEIKRLQKRAGKREEKSEVTVEDDILKLQFQPAGEDGKAIEGEEAKEEKIVVNYFSPDISKSLIGKKQGYSQVVKLTEAFEKQEFDWIIQDWKLDEEKAKETAYLMTIQSIEEIIPKELTEDLFNEVYPGSQIKTEEDFRARIRQDDDAHWKNEARNRLDSDIFEALVHNTHIELPEGFLKKWLKKESKEEKTDEEVNQSYPQFDHEMRWRLISGKLIQENNLDVSEEDLRHNFRHRIGSYLGLNPHDEGNPQMESLVDNMMKSEKTVNESYSQLLTDKLFEFLRSKANIEEKEITISEFLKLPHSHHHEHE